MQITVDTSTATRAELLALSGLLLDLIKDHEKMAPADNPSTGFDFGNPVPVAPPVAVAPPAPVATATPPIAGIPLDAEGIPWDERIHAGSRTKVANGTWKAKKGLNDAAFVQRVKSELLAVRALPVAAPAQQTIPAPVFQQPQAAAAPVVLPPPAPQAAAPQTLGDLMILAGPLMASGQLTPDVLNAHVMGAGIPNLAALATANRPDLVAQIWQAIKPV